MPDITDSNLLTSINDSVDEIVAAMDDYTSVYDVPYILMGRENGKDVTELQHLVRSLVDLLTTPLGSMPTLRGYGSNLFYRIDKPMNEELRMDMLMDIHLAVDRWEPRLRLDYVEVHLGAVEGQLILDLKGYYLLEGRAIALNNLRLDFKKDLVNQYED